VTSDFRPEVEI